MTKLRCSQVIIEMEIRQQIYITEEEIIYFLNDLAEMQ